jgi:hypothetical protein
MKSTGLLLPLAILSAGVVTAQTTKPELVKKMIETQAVYEDIALKIWSYAEVGYQETKSSGLL